MKTFFAIVAAITMLGACNDSSKSGKKQGLAGGDAFPQQYMGANFSCTGMSTDSRQYTLVASVTSNPVDPTAQTQQLQASLIDQSAANMNGGYNNVGNVGVGQSQPAIARFFQGDSRLILTPSNAYGTQANWSGEMQIRTLSNQASFNGMLNGMQINLPNMSCTQTGGGAYSTVTGDIPQSLTCSDTQYNVSVNNSIMTVSRTGGAQETYTLITNSQVVAGQTVRTYSVSNQTGTGGSGTVTVSQAASMTPTTGAASGTYTLQMSNVYYQSQPVNSTLNCY